MFNELVTHITIEQIDDKEYEFTFNWSNQQWKDNYKELANIPNITTFTSLDKWHLLINIVNGTDSISYAVLYLEDENVYIKFIAKMLLKYGSDSVKFGIKL